MTRSDTTDRLHIEADGSFSPTRLRLEPGDTLVVRAEVDAVLCIDSAKVFGENRYEIPAGRQIELTVEDDAPGGFDFIVQTGDLSAPCKGRRAATGEGSGKVGGGPD